MWLFLVPVAAFVIAFLVGAVVLWAIAKKSTITQTQTKAGTALHLHTPLGTLDSTPQEQLDPRLAQLPVYPGALRENAMAAETVTQMDFNHGLLQEVSSTYWTPASEDEVWKFYRQQLPEWPRNLDEARGKELIHPERDGVRLIRLTRDGDRTIIEICIKPVGYPHLFTSGGD
jgi:hypothetical protein